VPIWPGSACRSVKSVVDHRGPHVVAGENFHDAAQQQIGRRAALPGLALEPAVGEPTRPECHAAIAGGTAPAAAPQPALSPRRPWSRRASRSPSAPFRARPIIGQNQGAVTHAQRRAHSFPSSAAALGQAPVAERPVALPPGRKGGAAMETAEEYRQYAEECIRWAGKAKTEEE
jgi:hypothetical protein